MKKPTRVSEVLEEVLAAQGLSSVSWMVRVSSEWEGIVGPILASNSSPSKLKNGVLTVLVRDHAWAQELQLRKPVLLRGISEALREERVRDIRFVTGLLPGAETAVESPTGKPLPDAAPVAEPEGLSAVGDPETREILRSISRKALSRKRR